MTTTTAPNDVDSGDSLTWTEATAELQQILDRLDGEEIDVDEVAASVERAAELVLICRNRLRGARQRVDEALASIDENDDE